jgi:myosin heavy subunit
MAKEDLEVYLVHNQLRNRVLLPRLEKSPHYKLDLSPSDRSRMLDRFKAANTELNNRYMGGSLSQNWFALDDQQGSGKSVYGIEAISDADLSHKLSEIAVAFAMELQTAQSDLQTAQSELRTAHSERQITHSELLTAQSGLQAAQAELQAAQSELQAARSELQAAQLELHAAHAKLQSGQSEMQAKQSELRAVQTELDRVYRTKAWRIRKSILGYMDRIRRSIRHKN